MLKRDTSLEISQRRTIVLVQIQRGFETGDALFPPLVLIMLQAFLKVGKDEPDVVLHLSFASEQFVNLDRLFFADDAG